MASSPYRVRDQILRSDGRGRFIVRKCRAYKDPETGTTRANMVVQRVFKLNENVQLVLPNTPMEEVSI